MADPWAGFTDNGPQALHAGADPWKGFEDRGPGKESGRKVTAGQAIAQGVADTAGFGLAPALQGLSEVSKTVSPGFHDPIIGAGKMLINSLSGKPDPEVGKAYERGRAAAAEDKRLAKEQYPKTFMGAQIGGAFLGPTLGAGGGATVGARAVRGAVAGGLQGAAYGAGEATGEGEPLPEIAKRGAIGGGIGFGAGGVMSPVADVAGAGIGKGAETARTTYNWLKTELNPSKAEDVINTLAARRVAEAHVADRTSRGGPAFTPEETAVANEANVPRTIADLGGERTLATARAAANENPEARAALERAALDRYHAQSTRAASFIQNMVGGQTTTVEGLKQAARLENRPAYAKAYSAAPGELASPELSRLAEAPPVAQAMKEVATSGKTRAIADNLPPPNPAVKNMQFWDYTYRGVRDAADELMASGRTRDGSALSTVATQMRTELDKLVPDYQKAREGAASFFGASDALEAGQKFVHIKGENADFARQIAAMKPSERQLFQQGFASELADRIREIPDRADVLKQSFFSSPAARERISMALGADKAKKLETYLHVEGIVDKLRGAVLGNSTTYRQWAERGLAGAGTAAEGSALWDYLKEGDVSTDKIASGLGLALMAYGKRGGRLLDEGVAKRVGELLTSDDPALLSKGINIVSHSPKLLDVLRGAHGFVTSIANRGTGTRAVVTQGTQAVSP